jgi:hypothetical protein
MNELAIVRFLQDKQFRRLRGRRGGKSQKGQGWVMRSRMKGKNNLKLYKVIFSFW